MFSCFYGNFILKNRRNEDQKECVTMTNKYELIFIFNRQESVYHSSLKNVQELLKSKNVNIISEEDMKVKPLGYPVKRQLEGHYYLFVLEADSLLINELTSELKHFDEILKFMFVKLEYKKMENKRAS